MDLTWDGDSLAGVFQCETTKELDVLITTLEHVKHTLPAMAYIYRWDRHGRKGQPCNVTARSRRGNGFHNFNSICVEFADGYRMVTSGNAIRRAPPGASSP